MNEKEKLSQPEKPAPDIFNSVYRETFVTVGQVSAFSCVGQRFALTVRK